MSKQRALVISKNRTGYEELNYIVALHIYQARDQWEKIRINHDLLINILSYLLGMILCYDFVWYNHILRYENNAIIGEFTNYQWRNNIM